jgi:hypothetical protein
MSVIEIFCWTLLGGTVLYAIADAIRRSVDPEQRRRRHAADNYGMVDAGSMPGTGDTRKADSSDGWSWWSGGGDSADGGGGGGGD